MIRFQPTSLEPFLNDYQSIVSSALFCWKGELCSIYRSPFVVLKTLNVSYTINIYDMNPIFNNISDEVITHHPTASFNAHHDAVNSVR